MERLQLKTLNENTSAYGGKTVVVAGWARTIRDSKAFGFIELNDGSCFKCTQIVFERENLENYIKRLQQLETICNEFKGVDKSYAIQAGREVRIIVKPDQINDSDAVFLVKDIAKKIENEMQYPGQIKVVVIRENRFTDTAK